MMDICVLELLCVCLFLFKFASTSVSWLYYLFFFKLEVGTPALGEEILHR